MTLDKYRLYLINNLNISEDTIDCVTSINGYNEYALDNILYYYTGYRNIEQYTEYEDSVTYEEYYKGGEE